MKKFTILIIMLCFACVVAQAEYYPPVPYGVAITIDFPIYASDGSLSTSETDGGTDIQVYCGAGDTPAASTNDFVDDGDTYTVTLTAAEMQCAYVKLQIAGATDNNVIIIPTYGNASAQIEGVSLLDDAITASKIAASAIGASEIATDAIGAAELAADAGTEIGAAVGDLVVEDTGSTYTLECVMAAMLSYAGGEVSTTAGTSTYQDPGGNENRIVGTVTGSTRNTITITCP